MFDAATVTVLDLNDFSNVCMLLELYFRYVIRRSTWMVEFNVLTHDLLCFKHNRNRLKRYMICFEKVRSLK